MKRLFKKVFMTVAGFLMATSAALAGSERPIEVDQLPTPAKQMVMNDFRNRKVAMTRIDDGLFRTSYDVVFTNGDKVEFDSHGEWKDITCKHSQVPSSVVPRSIRNYLKSHYPGNRILEIEKSHGRYEVSLDNGLEITFNKDMKVVDIE